jgi:hypothetical protein
MNLMLEFQAGGQLTALSDRLESALANRWPSPHIFFCRPVSAFGRLDHSIGVFSQNLHGNKARNCPGPTKIRVFFAS